MTHGAPASFAASMPRRSSSSDGLRFDDDGIGAGIHQRLRLLLEGGAHLLFGEVAVGFHQAAERADIADHVAFPRAERLRARSPRRRG